MTLRFATGLKKAPNYSEGAQSSDTLGAMYRHSVCRGRTRLDSLDAGRPVCYSWVESSLVPAEVPLDVEQQVGNA
jgi:hypothetical protein